MNSLKMAMVVVASVFGLWACSSHDSSESLLNPKAEDDVDVPDSLKAAYTQTITESDVARDLSVIAKALSVNIYPFIYFDIPSTKNSKFLAKEMVMAENLKCLDETIKINIYEGYDIDLTTRLYLHDQKIQHCIDLDNPYYASGYYWHIDKNMLGLKAIFSRKAQNINGIANETGETIIKEILTNAEGLTTVIKNQVQIRGNFQQIKPVSLSMFYGLNAEETCDYRNEISQKSSETMCSYVGYTDFYFMDGSYYCRLDMKMVYDVNWSCELTHDYQVVGRIDSERGVRTVYDADGVLVKLTL